MPIAYEVLNGGVINPPMTVTKFMEFRYDEKGMEKEEFKLDGSNEILILKREGMDPLILSGVNILGGFCDHCSLEQHIPDEATSKVVHFIRARIVLRDF